MRVTGTAYGSRRTASGLRVTAHGYGRPIFRAPYAVNRAPVFEVPPFAFY